MDKLKRFLSKKGVIVFIVALIITLASFSFAFFLSSDMFNNNIATTNCFKISFTDRNDINLDKAYPLSESEGSNLTPYEFTIKNVCGDLAEYQVNMETLNTSTLDTEYLRIKLDDRESSILKRYELNDTNINQNVKEGRKLTKGTLRANEEKTYQVRIWIDENTTIEQSENKEYYGKITVSAVPKKEVHDVEIAYIVDGVEQDAPPAKNDGYIIKNVECENADGVWDNAQWWLIVKNITGRAKCDLEFEKANYNNVPKWLQIANVNKDYTTLEEVFNDTDTLQTLMSNNTACDYLDNSTDWVDDITSNENAMTYLGNDDYCGNKLTYDNNWDEAIVNSTYWDKVLRPLVPAMTSNSSSEGEVIFSSVWNNYYDGYLAFDNTIGAYYWASGTPTGSNSYIGYKFANDKKVLVKKVRVRLSSWNGAGAYPYKLQGSNDLTNWTDIIDLGTTSANKDQTESMPINRNSYNSYRIIFPNGSGANNNSWWGINLIQFYGR